jgi:hypothetical protein
MRGFVMVFGMGHRVQQRHRQGPLNEVVLTKDLATLFVLRTSRSCPVSKHHERRRWDDFPPRHSLGAAVISPSFQPSWRPSEQRGALCFIFPTPSTPPPSHPRQPKRCCVADDGSSLLHPQACPEAQAQVQAVRVWPHPQTKPAFDLVPFPAGRGSRYTLYTASLSGIRRVRCLFASSAGGAGISRSINRCAGLVPGTHHCW